MSGVVVAMVAALTVFVAPSAAAHDVARIFIPYRTAPLYLSQAGIDEKLYPTVLVTGKVPHCPAGDDYLLAPRLWQDGREAWEATGGGRGAWDVQCTGDGTDSVRMWFYNPDHRLHPGRAFVSFKVLTYSGDVVAQGKRTIWITGRCAPRSSAR